MELAFLTHLLFFYCSFLGEICSFNEEYFIRKSKIILFLSAYNMTRQSSEFGIKFYNIFVVWLPYKYREIPLWRQTKIKTFCQLKTLFAKLKLFFSSFSTPSVSLITDHLWNCPKVVFKTTFGQSQRWSYYRDFTVYDPMLSKYESEETLCTDYMVITCDSVWYSIQY